MAASKESRKAEGDGGTEKLRVLVADDHEALRHGVRLLIEREPNWQVCGEASDGKTAVSMTEKLKPDVVILDLDMPGLRGLDATKQIKRMLPTTEVLIFTGSEDDEVIHAVFEAGARSYILKSDVTQHLMSAIRSLGKHKHYFTTKISEIVFARYLEGKSKEGGNGKEEGLTPREREIVQLLAEGKSNKTVGSILNISVKTVETHRAATMRKLQLESFAELVRYAIRNKIVEA